MDWLFEIGPVAGDQPLGWQDFAAWQQITGIALKPWEARAIRKLSAVFLSERIAARKPERLMPYTGTDKEAEDRVTSQFKAMFKAFGG